MMLMIYKNDIDKFIIWTNKAVIIMHYKPDVLCSGRTYQMLIIKGLI